eukprot:PITA_24421
MHDDESIASFSLKVDEIVNSMRNLSEEIKYATIVENILRSLTTKFDSKVFAIEEMHDLQSLTLDQLHGILKAFEIRKGGTSDMREANFKSTSKGKEKEELGYVLEEEELNFVKKLQVGIGRFRCKLPFKCFACGRFGHYAANCPYRENHEKGKEVVKINKRRFENKRSFYTHEDSDGISNGEEEQVWDKIQAIHEETPKRELPGNPILKNVSTFAMSNGVINSKEGMLEEIFDIRKKLDLALKNIVNLKDKLQAYDNKNHAGMISKQYCEGLESEIVSLRADLEKSDRRNEELL